MTRIDESAENAPNPMVVTATSERRRTQRPPFRWFIVLLLAAMGVVASWYFWGGQPTGRSRAARTLPLEDSYAPPEKDFARWNRHSEYVGSQACRDCHREQFDTYLQTAHSSALTPVNPADEPADGLFDHRLSGRRYRAVRRDGKLWHEESVPGADGAEVLLTSLPVAYRVGSGRFGRTYLCEAQGFLVESPITWYEPRHGWGMSPGYDSPQHQSFERVIPESCLLCHAGQLETNAGSELRMRLVEDAIGCERCHGPGRAHIEQRSAADAGLRVADDSIVNPQRLSRRLSEAVCQQCHLQGDIQFRGRGVRVADFRPGEPLEKYRCEFRIRKPGNMMTIVGHFEQLALASCYRQSDSLTCVTCHDPHAPVAPEDKAGHYRSVCLSCHAEPDCKLPLPEREKSENDCVRCHMPGSETEVPHVAFTHHRIGIHPLHETAHVTGRNEPLIPLSDLTVLSEADRQRALALSWTYLFLRLGPDMHRAQGQELARRVEVAMGNLPEEAVDAPVEVARAEFNLARGDVRGASLSAERALAFEELQTGDRVRALVVLANVDFREGRFATARGRYLALTRLRRDPSDWHLLGLVENNCGNIEAAIRALETSSGLDPAAPGPYEALAAIHHARREFDAEDRVRARLEQLSGAAD